jgi:hypothetical protein
MTFDFPPVEESSRRYAGKNARVWKFETSLQNESWRRFELLAQRRVLPSGEIKILSPEEVVALQGGESRSLK